MSARAEPHDRFGAALFRAAITPAVLAVLATVAGGVGAVALPGQRPLVLHSYLVAIGVLGVWAGAGLLRAALPSAPSELRRALPRRPPPAPAVAELARMERDVAFATTTAFDFHVRLRRTMRDIAVRRLWTRHGVDADHDPDAARRVLGAGTWDLLDGGPPADRLQPGLRTSELRALVDTLEEL